MSAMESNDINGWNGKRIWETSGVRAQHTIAQVQESLVYSSAESVNLYMIAYIQGAGVKVISSHLRLLQNTVQVYDTKPSHSTMLAPLHSSVYVDCISHLTITNNPEGNLETLLNVFMKMLPVQSDSEYCQCIIASYIISCSNTSIITIFSLLKLNKSAPPATKQATELVTKISYEIYYPAPVHVKNY